MLRTRFRTLALLPLCAALLLAACGKEEQSTPPATSEPLIEQAAPASTPPTAAPAPQPVETRMARFEGVLPCADCPGIETTLTLNSDELGRKSFRLKMLYQESGDTPPLETTGAWLLEADPARGERIVRLNAGTPDRQTSYAIQPDGSLLMLDASGEPAASGLDYSLERTAGDLDLSKTEQSSHPPVSR